MTANATKRRLGIYANHLDLMFEWLEETIANLDSGNVATARDSLVAMTQAIEDCRGDVQRGRMLPGNVKPGDEWLAKED